jgi:hypothetical protein
MRSRTKGQQGRFLGVVAGEVLAEGEAAAPVLHHPHQEQGTAVEAAGLGVYEGGGLGVGLGEGLQVPAQLIRLQGSGGAEGGEVALGELDPAPVDVAEAHLAGEKAAVSGVADAAFGKAVAKLGSAF